MVKPALKWLQWVTIGLIIFLLVLVYAFQVYQYVDAKIIKARLDERSEVTRIFTVKSDSMKLVIIYNQNIILSNQDSLKKLLKNRK